MLWTWKPRCRVTTSLMLRIVNKNPHGRTVISGRCEFNTPNVQTCKYWVQKQTICIYIYIQSKSELTFLSIVPNDKLIWFPHWKPIMFPLPGWKKIPVPTATAGPVPLGPSSFAWAAQRRRWGLFHPWDGQGCLPGFMWRELPCSSGKDVSGTMN